MRRVAYVCADAGVPVFGTEAASIQVQAMLRALQALGAQVQLFAANLGGSRPAGLDHVRVHNLSPLPKAAAAEREQAAIRGNAELRSLLDHAGPFDIIYERYSRWSYAGMEAAGAAHIAGLLEVSGSSIDAPEIVDRDAAEQVARRAFGAAGAVIAASRTVAHDLHHRFPDLCSRITVVPAGIDPARFPARPQPFERRRAGAFTIGAVGRFEPRHGQTLLLDAFAQVRDTVAGARLLICGDAPEHATLRAAIDERGLREVIDVAGRVTPADIPELLGRMDAAVAAHDEGADFYSSPLALHEYMAASVPVVASRSAELEELIDDGITGVWCEPGDAGALARALELLAGNPLLRARLGGDARAHVLRRHSWDAAAERVLNLAAVLAVSPAA